MDGLTEIVQHLAMLKLSPDADIDILTRLETEIIGYLQQVNQEAMQGSQQTMSRMTGALAPMQGGPVPAPQGAGGFGALPPVDDLRRLMTGTQ